jgi:anti-anti-sigma factor
MTDHPSPPDFANGVVHQATGMVAVQLECSVDDAFRALIDAAADRDISVIDLARQIVDRTTRLAPAAVGSVDLVHNNGRASVVLRGEVDLALADELTRAITAAMSRPRVVIDLTHATFIDSTVIAALVAAHDHAATTSTDLTVVPGPDNVMRTLSVGGVDGLFAFTAPPDVDDSQGSGKSHQ